MDKTDWFILDSLTDDYESIGQIYSHVKKEVDIDIDQVKERLLSLLEHRYIFIDDAIHDNIKELDKELIDEELTYSWFGLTNEGAAIWEENTERYSGHRIDWDEICLSRLDYEGYTGSVIGKSNEKCLETLEDLFNDQSEIRLNRGSVKIEHASGLDIKYYKRIEEGYRISFRFTENPL